MIKSFFSSRTIWTIIVTFVINGIPSIRGFIPAVWLPIIDAVLAVLAAYFHINPQVAFGKFRVKQPQ